MHDLMKASCDLDWYFNKIEKIRIHFTHFLNPRKNFSVTANPNELVVQLKPDTTHWKIVQSF